jgi:hypothetical protein
MGKRTDRTEEADFFKGRYLIEIGSWDWEFFLGVSPSSDVMSTSPQLLDARAITIDGRILAPRSESGQTMRLFITPMRSEYVLRVDPPSIGILSANEAVGGECELEAQACIPEEVLTPVLQSLSSVWKFAHIWTTDHSGYPRPITNLSFSRDIPLVAKEWMSRR